VRQECLAGEFFRDPNGKTFDSRFDLVVLLKFAVILGETYRSLFKNHADYAKMLKAIKGVGNEGSHGSELSRQDLLMAYKIINHVLISIYVKSKQHNEILQITNDLENRYN
jgi:hypothetical protein